MKHVVVLRFKHTSDAGQMCGAKRPGAPSQRSMMSSNKSKVSGAGCSRATTTLHFLKCTRFAKHCTIWNVVLLSSPVLISANPRAPLSQTQSPTWAACKKQTIFSQKKTKIGILPHVIRCKIARGKTPPPPKKKGGEKIKEVSIERPKDHLDSSQ